MTASFSAEGGELGRRVATRRVRRPRVLRLLWPLVLAGLAACGPPSLSNGIWFSEEGAFGEDPTGDGTDQYVLSFDRTGGLISGTMHRLADGKQLHRWSFAGTRKQSGELELSWGQDNTLNAVVNLERNEIEATVRLASGDEVAATFRRGQAAELPGFEALPEGRYRWRSPAPGSGWEEADPLTVGLSPRHLQATVRAVARGDAGLLHSLVITRRGKLVLEEYFHGYAREDLHELQSVTKSVTSLLVGSARERGAIGDLGTPVLEWFPEYVSSAPPGWEKVTLEHLLTMTAGLDWERDDVLEPLPPGPALFDAVFARRVVHEPGSRLLYNGSDVEVLGGVLRRATGLSADELAAKALFRPLGITAWDWEQGKVEGYPSLAGTLALRPLDMAKIGQMVLDGGRWQGEQVISEEWIAESTAPLVDPGGGPNRYGYLWTRLDAPLEAGPHPVITASGWGSQFIHIVPALDTVIVITGGNHFNGKTWAIDQVLLRELVPGVER